MSVVAQKIRQSAVVFAALAIALATSAVLSRFLTGVTATVAGLLIAVIKMVLIALFFMRLREQRGLLRLAALTGLAWLALLLGLMLADYGTRDWRTAAPVSTSRATVSAGASGNSP
ncbi:MAG TPA: cytochrome C oxidase subunit IV family protein [Candidatus Didemnitutus sp.]|nr:cytochrome C oxidase subunit IV family protein [Candidatus Didemnitutus sp.]